MPKIAYVNRRFSPKSLAMIAKANEIIEDYAAQGFELTLRQLYYQFVSKDLIPNTQKEYKNLGSVINDGRLAGLIDWLAIVDRTRNLRSNSHWDGPKEIVMACSEQFQIDKWADQDHIIEVWIEKDALVGVIDAVCRKNDVGFFSCRGYTSQSEMWVAAQRLKKHLKAEKQVTVIHLGDHDPSGIDMSRDILDRLNLFCPGIEVDRIALTMAQIEKLKPPPNPAKTTDSRSGNYIREFGHESWELDALEPKFIVKLVQNKINSIRDEDKWDAAKQREQNHRDAIKAVAEDLEED